jgi:hypothetical protein
LLILQKFNPQQYINKHEETLVIDGIFYSEIAA